MVTRSLSDFSAQKSAIVTAIRSFIDTGNYEQSLHIAFKPSSFNIEHIELIIDSIEKRLRKIKIIYYTFYESEYEQSIIINNTFPTKNGSPVTKKTVETEFNYGTYVLKDHIIINDPRLYKELVDTNFQTLILTVSSLLELLVRLTETLIKKIVIYDGKRLPYSNVPLKLFILNWDKLVDLGYRNNDSFYRCFDNYKSTFFNYLDQINTLRNRFIHGYSVNLETNKTHNIYLVTNHDTNGFPLGAGGINADLALDKFTQDVVTNVQSLTSDLLNLFVSELAVATKIPM